MNLSQKSSVEDIRHRFDRDVERFSQLEVGNTAQVDSVLSLDLIADVAARTNPDARRLLDIGCGAGNYTLKLLSRLPSLEVTLADLSQPMLVRAKQRIGECSSAAVSTMQGDVRELDLGENVFDIVVAGAVLHHLRGEQEWFDTFAKIHRSLAPGGTFWVYDLLDHEIAEVADEMKERHGRYLVGLKGEEYRDLVFGWIEQEDSPRPLTFQLDVLRQVGFEEIDVLHKNVSFAVFGGRKRRG